MMRYIIGHNQTVFDGLHPTLYKALFGLAIWFVLSAWTLFGGSGYLSLTFAIITLFFLIAILIPVALWHTWRRHPEVSGLPDQAVAFRDWMTGTFEAWQRHVRGSEAAVQVLLPIAAVAFGLTAIGIVLRITA